ncbi:tautomerase family protein [Paraburkholderia sp. BCC1886]|uniref:tautomerase family protein n=1 Tax=Paraburkholderia sp. BCC1886 TaxID=2562670 RepID=UPI001183E5D4|nr:tautomerase family protein [Paraburkholderia sp. BCC1886]
MPTYIVSSTTGLLSDADKAGIAREITRAHTSATGAQGFFAQVIFTEIPSGAHFMGGVKIETRQVFVHGHVRAGRTAEQKAQLLADIVESVERVTKLQRRFLWAYISELPPGNMIEYGQVLPQPGAEQAWFEALPEEERDYLQSFAKTQER